jgi:hypothetical protein
VRKPAAPTNGHNALWIMLTPTSWGVGGWGRDRGRALMRRERPRFYSILDNANMKLSTRLWKTSIGNQGRLTGPGVRTTPSGGPSCTNFSAGLMNDQSAVFLGMFGHANSP